MPSQSAIAAACARCLLCLALASTEAADASGVLGVATGPVCASAVPALRVRTRQDMKRRCIGNPAFKKKAADGRKRRRKQVQKKPPFDRRSGRRPNLVKMERLYIISRQGGSNIFFSK
jgi:hypothetical protein